jgi:phosphopantothenoylcysteine decarboxylase/phosphopantothenate--cysteine ligase
VDVLVATLDGTPVRSADPGTRPPRADGPARDADLEGRHVVVTAGGTREPIDPVRYIGNRSTGRMGAAVAAAALDRGARVTIVAASVEVPMPTGADVIRVETAAQLQRAMLGLVADKVGGLDVLVMAAAVADFGPADRSPTKLHREDGLTLQLVPTPDILAEVAARLADPARGRRPVLVGFAAETGSLDRAPDKLRRKGVDLLVANDVTAEGSGFGTVTNQVSLLASDGSRDDLPLLPKRDVADRLLDKVVAMLDERGVRHQTS